MIQAARVAPLLRNFGAVGPLASPNLVVIDHGDNTGATATVTGAALGSVNDVYVRDFAGGFGSGTWSSAGSVNNNGSASLGLATGHYFAYAASSLGGSTANSNVVYFAVTDGLESIHTRCLTAAQARVRLLALAGLPNSAVVIEKLPDVLVTILDRDNQEPTLQANLDRHLLWRQQIARAFRNQRLNGVPEVINAEVESAEGLLEESWKRELMTSAVLLRFTSRESRGF
jgi:hypothetical protein